MIIKKKAGTYDVYTLEVSYGELQAFRVGLEADHANPVGDEKLTELAWYLERIPGPGEEEEKAPKAEKEGEVEGEDLPIPMPPGQAAGTPPEGDGEEAGVPSEEEMSGAGGIDEPGPELGLPEPEMGEEGGGEPAEPELDLPKPPRE